ncbi:MAG: chromosome segregation protein SMC [Tissierella sp.]|uniref:chromosome segregation protein SMC n=1 Tax=Tissierella sp. TaxID=41274 RepID=UPI003F97370A
MYLKKIHIQGFKSFADKTEIKFKDDITAIVGPNGSGKSNISDAVRWVLGEQSVKNLRGSKMEDIIFSGTNKRRALSFSEVTIFFDNKDGSIPLEYSEVAVTRRMFRSGESEYYINKNACRLKDIRLTFMDTGIGKDGYSIIGQGKIDDILSNKPEDRRNIFEEAAGIIKYKTKKEESQRKLKNTSDNLIRINDLISEISIQHKKLESDSKKANKFISYFDELKGLETNLYIRDIKNIEKQKIEIKTHKKEIDEEIDKNEKTKQEKQNSFDLLKKQIEEIENKIEVLRQEKDETSKLKEKTKNNNSLLFEKENFNTRDLKRLDDELINLTSQNSILNKEILEMNTKQNQVSKEYKNLNQKYEEKNKYLKDINSKIIGLEKNIANKKEEMDLIYEQIADKRGKLNNIQSSNLNNQDQEKRLELEKEKLYKKINIIEEKIKDLNQNQEELESHSESYTKDTSIYKLQKEELEKEREKNIKNIRTLEKNIERTYSSYNLYKNMQNSYEGYYKSVKNLIKAIENNNLDNKGFHGTVADLLFVDSLYETAINISLGGNLQNIVVNNEKTAQNMIKYLKDNKLGRVTFLPINTIKGKTLTLNIKDLKQYGFIGLANELIRYSKKYENIFKSLLGRTIVIDNIENAINFAKKTNYIYRIVTLEGEILNPGGSLSGGSYKNNISIINRKKKIEEMRISLDDLELSLDSSKKNDINTKKKIELSQNKINTLEKEFNKCNINIINIKNEQKSLKNEREFIQNDIIKTESQIKYILKTKKDTLEQSIRDEETLKKDLSKFESIKEKLSIKSDLLKENKILKDKAYEDINSINLNIQLIKNKINNFKTTIKNNLEKKKENDKLI